MGAHGGGSGGGRGGPDTPAAAARRKAQAQAELASGCVAGMANVLSGARDLRRRRGAAAVVRRRRPRAPARRVRSPARRPLFAPPARTREGAGYPFDTVKVRLQSNPAAYRGMADCFRQVVRSEGVRRCLRPPAPPALPAQQPRAAFPAPPCPAARAGLNALLDWPTQSLSPSRASRPPAAAAAAASQVAGLFRGLPPPLLGGAAETGINYLVYSRALAALQEERGLSRGAAIPLAAAAGGVALSFVLSPAELLKCRMQVSSGAEYSGALACLRATLAAEGPAGLTRGLGATMAREVPGNAIFFTTYEWLRGRVVGGRLDGARAGAASWRELAADAGGSVLCGGLAGAVMWAAVLPIDVAKTRLQTAAPGSAWDIGVAAHLRLVRACAPLLPLRPAAAQPSPPTADSARPTPFSTQSQLWREGGPRRLYAGLLPTLVRAFPANACQWLAWEAALRSWAPPP